MGRPGFTAIELIVTVLIISILMTGVLPTISVLKNSRDVGEELKSAADKVAIELGVSVYQILYDRLPNSVEELIYSGVILGEGTGKLEYVEGMPMLR